MNFIEGSIHAHLGLALTGQSQELLRKDRVGLAYPDRVGTTATGGAERYLLRNGTGAVLVVPRTRFDAPFLAIAELDGRAIYVDHGSPRA